MGPRPHQGDQLGLYRVRFRRFRETLAKVYIGQFRVSFSVSGKLWFRFKRGNLTLYCASFWRIVSGSPTLGFNRGFSRVFHVGLRVFEENRAWTHQGKTAVFLVLLLNDLSVHFKYFKSAIVPNF